MKPIPPIQLRDVEPGDLPTFFEHQRDPDANRMAAFTSRNPEDRDAFIAHWQRILADPSITKKTILFAGVVAGNIVLYDHDGRPEIGYWIGREFWGRGIATRAVALFLKLIPTRPIYASAAKDNLGSIRVLEKSGFRQWRTATGYANSRGQVIEEVILIREE